MVGTDSVCNKVEDTSNLESLPLQDSVFSSTFFFRTLDLTFR